MGILIKSLLILFLLSWLIRGIIGYFSVFGNVNRTQNLRNNTAKKNAKTGDVNISSKPRDKKIKKNVGEYVDYEEIH
jgi:hypothetical protein